MSTAQVESVLVEHKKVAEAAVVAAPHKVKGECLYCFVTPKDGCKVRLGIIFFTLVNLMPQYFSLYLS